MQQRAQQQPAKGSKKGAPPAQPNAPAPDDSAATATAGTTSASSANKQIRTVGPKFLQDNSTPSVPR
jgi:hypothetical protein